MVMAYGWKGSTAYCEAPPCTHVGSARVWAAGASVWTAPGLGMARPPSLGAEESTTGGGQGVVAACRWKGATDYCEALPCTQVSWRLGGRGILQDGPWLGNGHSAVAGGGGIDDGGDGISSLCLGETGRGLVCGPSMDPRRFSWRLVGMGIFLDVRRHWWRRNQVRCGGGGGGVSSRRTGGKGATVYCEAPPWTNVGSGGDWTAGASFWTASCLGMASPPSLGEEESTTGGGHGVVMAYGWERVPGLL